jgi:high-affinity iron transporter
MLSFREVLEIGLLSSLILTYLSRAQMGYLTRYVWLGIVSGVVASTIVGVLLWTLYGGLPEAYETLFESLTLFLAAGVLTWVLFWLAKHRNDLLKKTLQKHVDAFSERKAVGGIFILAFLMVFREGIEIVLFLLPFFISAPAETFVGTLLGATIAAGLSCTFFLFGTYINLKKVFYYSSLVIVLIVAGMVGSGTHELIEFLSLHGTTLGWFGDFAYRLSISSDSIWSHKGVVGLLFAFLFGYTSEMEWGRLLVQVSYMAVFIPKTVGMYRTPAIDMKQK